MRQLYLAGFGVGLLTSILSGCGTKSSQSLQTNAAPVTQAQVQAIENNPKISPRDKAAFQASITPSHSEPGVTSGQ